MPFHHLLDEYLTASLDASDPGSLPASGKAPLFRALSRKTKQLGDRLLTQPDAFAMVCRRAEATGIATRIGNHASTRTTPLYDRRRDDITLAEVERVRL